jgi:hypothetical protein
MCVKTICVKTLLCALLLAGLPVASFAQPPSVPGSDDSLVATAYIGWAFDTFAPDSIGDYPPGTVTTTKNRTLFGVDFNYRLAGHESGKGQFWLSGETLHGVRSVDINCEGEDKASPLCNPKPGLDYAKQVLTDQTSIEAYVTPRYEFKKLQADSNAPTWLYATARVGFVAVTSAPRVYPNTHVGMGLRVADGPFEGSMLEGGWGNNELFSGAKWRRLKIDGLMTFGLDGVPGIGEKVKFFVQMYIDNDVGGPSSDSIQTFLGFDIDIRKFFGQ